MAIIKKILNIFKSGNREEEEARLRAQRERYENFLRALTSGDLDTRWNAVRSVGDLGEPFIEPLINGLRDEFWIIRRALPIPWARSGHLQSVPLIGALADPGEDVREETIRALQLIGEPVVNPLTQALKHNHPFIRRGAVQALGIMGESRAVPNLIDALKDADPWVRHEAAVALGRVGDPHAVAPLIESLNDPLEHVRMAAMATLCSLGQASISPLIQALVDKNEDVSRRAALALATIGEHSVEPLIAALSSQNPGIRKEAASVLGQIGNTTAIPALIDTLTDPDRAVRIDVVKALAALGVPVIAPLMQVFREGDVRTRTGAMEALWMLGQPATTPLIMVLKDDQSDVRKRAALLLGEIGDQKAADHLTGLLSDENVSVRREAFEALEMIKKRDRQ